MRLRHFLSVLALLLASCSANAPTNSSSCTPGATVACTCGGGASGAQVCNAVGTLDACRCLGVDGGGDPGLDAATPDVATPTDVTVTEATAPDATAPDAGSRDAPTVDAPDGGADAGPPCTGVSLAADGVLDLDVRAVRVRGTVTFNGAPAPAASARGTVTFARREGGFVTRDLSTSGAATYDALLAPGTYDVRYAPPTGACAALPAPLPCAETTLREGVTLSADGALDLDVQSVLVRGTATLNGAAFPNASGERGSITLTRDGGGSVTAPLGATGAAAWSARVPRGVYAVGWAPSGEACTDAVGAPCIAGPLRTGVSLTADGVLDLDVRSIRVTGAVTVNDAPFVGSGILNQRYLYFISAGGAYTIAYPGTGGTYRVTLLPGTYDVRAYGAGDCTAEATFPCGSSVLRAGVSLTASGVLDLAVRGVRVRGSLTVHGARPDASAEARTIVFTDPVGYFVPTPLTSPARSYGAFLMADSYNVVLGAGTCAAPTTTGLPCSRVPLRTTAPFTADGVLDFDLSTVRVRGTATLNGAARSDWSGSVLFQREGSVEASVPLGADGRYDVLIAAGTYDIAWPGLYNCAAASPFPCNGGSLRAGVALTSDGVLDFDLRAAHLRGAVTLNGAPMPASARGDVEFAEVGGGPVTAPISATGAATYDTTVLAGAYVVSHRGPRTDCDAVPCMNQRLRGCP